MNIPLTILLVEDDPNECNAIVKELDNYIDDFELIGVTNNSEKAYEYITTDFPDAIILDLELNQGGGNGLSLLERIQSSEVTKKPFVLVTTNNISTVTHQIAREWGADFIMTKNQIDYSAKMVLDFLKTTKSVILNRKTSIDTQISESPTIKAKRIEKTINNELLKIGINPKNKGFTYLSEAIKLVINGESYNLCQIIGEKNSKTESSVERAMHNAINKAWNTQDIEILLAYYTAPIKQTKGVPTLNEFIFYYANKVKLSI